MKRGFIKLDITCAELRWVTVQFVMVNDNLSYKSLHTWLWFFLNVSNNYTNYLMCRYSFTVHNGRINNCLVRCHINDTAHICPFGCFYQNKMWSSTDSFAISSHCKTTESTSATTTNTSPSLRWICSTQLRWCCPKSATNLCDLDQWDYSTFKELFFI